MLTIRISIAWVIAGISFSAVGFLLLVVQPITVKAQEPKQFQYRTVEVLPDTQAIQTKLNKYGTNGWELVTVSVGEMTEPRLIFRK